MYESLNQTWLADTTVLGSKQRVSNYSIVQQERTIFAHETAVTGQCEHCPSTVWLSVSNVTSASSESYSKPFQHDSSSWNSELRSTQQTISRNHLSRRMFESSRFKLIYWDSELVLLPTLNLLHFGHKQASKSHLSLHSVYCIRQ